MIIHTIKYRYYNDDAGQWRTTTLDTAYFDPQEAQIEADRLTATRKRIIENRKLVTEFTRQWNEQNPLDTSGLPEQKDIPKWPAGIAQKDITTSMRAERDEIKAHNDNASNLWLDRRNQWWAKRADAINAYARTLVSDPEELKAITDLYGYGYDYDEFNPSTYSVDTMEVK